MYQRRDRLKSTPLLVSGAVGRVGHRSYRDLLLQSVDLNFATPSCGTGGSIGRSRVPSVESLLSPGPQPSSSRENLVSDTLWQMSEWLGTADW